MIPIGLTLLVLTGVGPLLAWRKSTILNLRDQFLFPVLCGLVIGGTTVALGVRVWSSGLCFAFSGFVVGTIAQEFWRGARVRQQTTGTDLATALIGLVGRNKRRYGGYIIHVAIVLLFLGFAGGGFKQEETALLTPGQQVKIADYTIRHNALTVTDDGRKQMVTADMTVLRDGVELTKMYPARWFFRKHEDQPTTEVAIRRSLAEDLYVVMPQFEASQQSANVEITVNPLVNWVWLGFGLLAFGTLIALLPETAFAFAVGRVPDAAKTATASLLLLAIVLPAAVQAQDGSTGRITSKTAEQRDVEGKVICMCGSSGCVRSPLNNCPMRPACHGYDAQSAQLQKFINEGKSEDDILTAFVKEYGTAVLAIPSGGFNSLSWLLPYGLAFMGLLALVVTARRWSTQPAPAGAGGTDVTIDPAIDARLDDELRDLD
jgi:cytochrome c-type biogenesis protein CcmF